MAGERFTSDNQFDGANEETIERRPVLAELLSREELADAIIENGSEWRTDPDSNTKYRESRWEIEDSDELFFCMLAEIHDDKGTYYELSLRNMAGTGEKSYTFTNSSIGFSHTYDLTLEPEKDPSNEKSGQKLLTYLRGGYRQTEDGKRAEEQAIEDFNAMIGRYTAENALDYMHPSEISLQQAALSDNSELSEESGKKLFAIAKRVCDLYSTEDEFRATLFDAIMDYLEPTQTPTQTDKAPKKHPETLQVMPALYEK